MGDPPQKKDEYGSGYLIILPKESASTYTDIVTVVASATGLALALFITRIKEAQNFRRIGTSFALSMSLFLIAEVTWSYYEIILGEEAPTVGVADIFWVSGYIPLIYLCAETVWKHHVHIGVRDLLTVIGGWFVFFASVILPITFYLVIKSADKPLVELITLIFYPYMDAVLILLLSMILIMYRKASLLIYWQFFAVGVILFVMGDISYSTLAIAEIYTTGSLPDVFFILFYMIIALGLGIMVVRREIFKRIDPVGKYTISHVFLNYKNGCIISHAFSRRARQFTDDDVLMGMLTAIQDFARDSFADKSPDQLEQLKYGDLTFVLHRGKNVLLVAGIQGDIPSDIHGSFDEVLEHVEKNYGRILVDWDGSVAPLAGTKRIIASLLTEEEGPPANIKPVKYEKVPEKEEE
jgi:hypothetical protein